MPLMCYVLRHTCPNILIQNGITEKSCFINDNEQSTYFFFSLAKLQGLWDFSSLTRDRTQVLSHESMESRPLAYQGIPIRQKTLSLVLL